MVLQYFCLQKFVLLFLIVVAAIVVIHSAPSQGKCTPNLQNLRNITRI